MLYVDMLHHDWFHDWGIDMTYTLKPNGDYMYVMRKPTQSECDRYIRNGYTPPELDREHDRTAYMYARGETKPNYPMPALRMRTFNSLVKLGFTSAENNFDVDTVFEYYIKD